DRSAVHRTRVAVRRLRSTLRVFGPLLALTPAEVADADEELRWFAGLLGVVRDLQLERARFAAALERLPSEEVLGPVAARIEDTMHHEQLIAEEEVAQAMASDRCQGLRHLLGTWRHHPPVGEVDPDALRRRARKAAKKADRRLRTGCESGT